MNKSKLMFLFLALILLVLFFIGIIPMNDEPWQYSQEELHSKITRSPSVNFNSQMGNVPLVTTISVERIGALNMGRVLVKPSGNTIGAPIPVLITPYREIPVGSELKTVWVSYVNHAYMPIRILVESN